MKHDARAEERERHGTFVECFFEIGSLRTSVASELAAFAAVRNDQHELLLRSFLCNRARRRRWEKQFIRLAQDAGIRRIVLSSERHPVSQN